MAAFLLCSHVADRASSAASPSSYEGTNPTIRDPALDIIQPDYLAEAPCPDTITLTLGLQHTNFGSVHSPYQRIRMIFQLINE